jgi:hypothetical protein
MGRFCRSACFLGRLALDASAAAVGCAVWALILASLIAWFSVHFLAPP